MTDPAFFDLSSPVPETPDRGTLTVSSARLASDEEGIEQRMERLVSALLEGRVVPFLGAGISQSARQGNLDTAPKLSLRANDLAQTLAQALLGELSRDAADGAMGLTPPAARNKLTELALGTAQLSKDGKALPNWEPLRWHTVGANLCEKHGQSAVNAYSCAPKDGDLKIWPATPSLGEVAELCWSILGPVKTCDTLGLANWNSFLPTPAHHYLAALVREGLVVEILETNYDELVETAVKETFGNPSR
jgi:hypothetical protein